ncbi:actin organization and endocytosis protein [Allomyces javanicus]|nr:actin organization and endocytosis protein [Allomyces javanicus]
MTSPLPAPPTFVPSADFATYTHLFITTVGDYRRRMPAEHARSILVKSGVANDVLARVWSMADSTSAGALTFPEFCLAMALVKRAMADPNAVPPTLPPHIANEVASLNIQLGLPSAASVIGAPPGPVAARAATPIPARTPTPLAYAQPTGMVPIQPTGIAMQRTGVARGISPAPQMTGSAPVSRTASMGNLAALNGGTPPPPPPPPPASAIQPMTVPGIMASLPATSQAPSGQWLISHEEKLKYATLFKAWDTAGVGYLTGEQCRDIFVTSGLPQNILVHIWSLADIHNVGKLNADEFAIAMHLVYKKLNNVDLPTTLPEELVPSSQKDLDTSVSFMKDRLMQQILAEKTAAANSPSWVRGGHAHKGSRGSLASSNNDEPTGYVSRHRRKPQDAQPTDPAVAAKLKDLQRQIDQTRELLILKRSQHHRLRAAQGHLEDANTVRGLHAEIAQLQVVLKALKAQYVDKVRGGQVRLPAGAASSETADLVKAILGVQEQLNDVQLHVFKLRDRKKFKYAPIPQGATVNLTSLLMQPTKAAGSIMSEDERRKQKAAEMLAQRMAALGVSAPSSMASLTSSPSAAQGAGFSPEQQEAMRRIDAEKQRLDSALLDLRVKLGAMTDVVAAKALLTQFEEKLAVVEELLRPVQLPEQYVQKEAPKPAPTPAAAKPAAAANGSGDDLWKQFNKIKGPEPAAAAAPAPAATSRDLNANPFFMSSSAAVSTSSANVKDLATKLFGAPAPAPAPASPPTKPADADARKALVAQRKLSTDWLSTPSDEFFRSSSPAPAVPALPKGAEPTADPFAAFGQTKDPEPVKPAAAAAKSIWDDFPPTDKKVDAAEAAAKPVKSFWDDFPPVEAVKPAAAEKKDKNAASPWDNPFATVARKDEEPVKEEKAAADPFAAWNKSSAAASSPFAAPAPAAASASPFASATPAPAAASASPFASATPAPAAATASPFAAPAPAPAPAASPFAAPTPATDAALTASSEPEFQVTALYDYDSGNPDDLVCHEHDRLTVIQTDGEWYLARNSAGAQGWIPTSYAAGDGATPAAGSGVPGRMLYEYVATHDDEVSAPEGADVTVLDESDPDWWTVEYDGKTGVVPAAYVEKA